MDKTTHPYFVPDSTAGGRRETATLLVGTASEFDIPQREVASTQGGFRISENVYKALGWGEDDEPATDQTSDSVGDPDARQVPGEVVTGQVPVAPAEEDYDTETAQFSDAPLVTSPEGTDEPGEVDGFADLAEEVEEEESTEDVPPYSEWDYQDLKAEVAKRGIETPDQKGPTLVAALEAHDAASVEV